MKIGTKLLRGTYYCYATIDGYDYSFFDATMAGAQEPMRQILKKKFNEGKISSHVNWEPLEVIEQKKAHPKPQIRYGTGRIDNNPIA